MARRDRVVFPLEGTGSTPRIVLSRLNTQPARSPADASPRPSPAATHGLRPMRVATPSSQWTCTTYSLPAFTGAPPSRRCAPTSLIEGEVAHHLAETLASPMMGEAAT